MLKRFWVVAGTYVMGKDDEKGIIESLYKRLINQGIVTIYGQIL